MNNSILNLTYDELLDNFGEYKEYNQKANEYQKEIDYNVPLCQDHLTQHSYLHKLRYHW